MKQKPEDIKLERAHARFAEIFSQLHQEELKTLQEKIRLLKLDKDGNIAATSENMRIKAQILEDYRETQNYVIQDVIEPMAAQGVQFGTWYAAQGIKTMSPLMDIAIAENLSNSVNYVTSVQGQSHDKLRQILTSGIMTPGGNYNTIIDQIADVALKPQYAEVVFRGTVMQTFRQANAAHASDMKTEYYQHTGPAPRPMPNGHEFCIDHYGEVHTLEEWQDIAAGYGGQGGTDPDHLLEWCGGYQCRHGLRPVAPDNIEDAQADMEDYKSIQQDYLNELDEFANEKKTSRGEKFDEVPTVSKKSEKTGYSIDKAQRDDTERVNTQVKKYESKISKNDYETSGMFYEGKKIFEKTGNANQIEFNVSEVNSVLSNVDPSKVVFTHNHPSKGGGFSLEDVAFATKFNIGTFRAISSDGISYEMTTTPGIQKLTPNMKNGIVKSYSSIVKSEMRQLVEQIKDKSITKDQAIAMYRDQALHSAMIKLSDKYNRYITYGRYESEK